jgi:antitoxin PrlF
MGALTKKGQVTIPKRVRDQLGLKPGDEVEFGLTDDGRVALKKAKSKRAPKSRFAKIRGSATGGMTTDEIMRLTRGDDWGRDPR